jgi:hypothetical protein
MNRLYIKLDVSTRPNGSRVSRLLREIDSACYMERRKKEPTEYSGSERRSLAGRRLSKISVNKFTKLIGISA